MTVTTSTHREGVEKKVLGALDILNSMNAEVEDIKNNQKPNFYIERDDHGVHLCMDVFVGTNGKYLPGEVIKIIGNTKRYIGGAVGFNKMEDRYKLRIKDVPGIDEAFENIKELAERKYRIL